MQVLVKTDLTPDMVIDTDRQAAQVPQWKLMLLMAAFVAVLGYGYYNFKRTK